MDESRLDETWLDVLRCPESGNRLSAFDSWTFVPEPSENDLLFPMICRTPVLMPQVETYLQDEQLAVARACAEFGEDPLITRWFFNRYGHMDPPLPRPLDTQVWGEGYPGFWETVPLPEFVKPLVKPAPEDILEAYMSGRRLGWALDVGCGQGGMTQRMARICERVIGIEANFYLAVMANRLLAASSIEMSAEIPGEAVHFMDLEKPACDNTLVLCADAYEPPVQSGLFDWIHCGHLLDLVDDPERLVLRLKEFLRPGGTLSICTPWDLPDIQHFDGLLEVLANHFEEDVHRDGLPWLRYGHKRRFVLHEDWLWIGRLIPGT